MKKIITQCPHCYNTLKNEYPQYGGKYEVHHYAEVLAPIVAQGHLRPTKCLETSVTFHDPCYLGRHNDVYDAPRQILQAIPGINIVEMPKSKSRSFCCGGGGARAFMEEHTGERINATRVGQAQDTGASLVAAACPYCITMFDDGIKAKDLTDKLKVKDCVELLAETL